MQSLPLFSIFLIIVNVVATRYSFAFTRNDFPEDFVFGAASSAYQWEGAVDKDGRTPSVWDTFSHYNNRENGDIACDGYHKYKEDVKLMAEMGLEAFRFSISWTRLIPNGRGPINPKGLSFYKNLIKELLSHGIQPHVTLYHYDLPQPLEDEYGGWISNKIIEDFSAYADVCFREFGNDVKLWTTINEATIFAIAGYSDGNVPPGHCSPSILRNCTTGNSSTEPYLAAHNILLAHASASRLYKFKYRHQKGQIGLSVFAFGLSPYTNSKDDEIATQRAKDFLFGWMLRPLIFGDYPEEMKRIVGVRLPVFSEEESKQVKGSFDFIGIIHYLTIHVANRKHRNSLPKRQDFYSDMGIEMIFIGSSSYFEVLKACKISQNSSSFFRIVTNFCSIVLTLKYDVLPWGLEDILEYLKQSYNNPPIYILENGSLYLSKIFFIIKHTNCIVLEILEKSETGRPMKHDSLNQDTPRIDYIQGYIGAVLTAIRNGSDTRGYFVWSMFDLFELLSGYKYSYGLYYVNFSDPELKRSPKLSAKWYSEFLKGITNVASKDIIKLQSNFSDSSSL